MSSNKPSGESRTGSGQRSEALSRMKARSGDARDAVTSRSATADRGPGRAPTRTPTAGRSTATATAGRGSAAATSRPASDPRPAAKLARPAQKARVRRARLLVSKVDPWSVLKMAFLLSVALGIITVVASLVLWTVLDLTGVFGRINQMLGEVGGSEAFDLRTYASFGQVASFATVVAVTNIFLLTALSVLAAVLYNITSTLVGGIGVTLTDD